MDILNYITGEEDKDDGPQERKERTGPYLRRRENVVTIYPDDWKTVGLNTYRSWCRLPYHGHPKGCTMWQNKKKNCDTAFRKTQLFDDVFDRDAIAWMVWEVFDIGSYEKAMHKKHPDWSTYMCRNVLYWQGAVKKRRNERVKEWFRRKNLWGKYAGVTEGFCVNVYATLRNCGFYLEPIKSVKIMKKCCFIIKYKKGGLGEIEQRKAGRNLIIY